VAVLLEKADAHDSIEVNGVEIQLTQPIEFGHKAAIHDLKAEAPVYKYGEEIGYMLADIPKGGWIHSHNMGCRRGK
jgi:hypothetical protein